MNTIKSVRTRQFKRLFDRLPLHIQEIAEQKFKLFKTDPYHPSFRHRIIQSSLHFSHPHHEFRITRDYRATCFVDEDIYVWVFIGSHTKFDEIY
jgi:hypothetical protein